MADAIPLPAAVNFTDFFPADLIDLLRTDAVDQQQRADAQTKLGYGIAAGARGQAGLAPIGLFGDYLGSEARSAMASAFLRLVEMQGNWALQIFLQKMRDASALAQIEANGDVQKEIINLRAEKNDAAYAVYKAALVDVATAQYASDIQDFKNFETSLNISAATEADVIEAKAIALEAYARPISPPIIPPQPPYV